MMAEDVVGSAPDPPSWRTVAVPSEHGGWGLTLEPVLLGLLIAPSMVGVMLGVGGFVAFLVRSPLKLVVIDLRRGRWLDRSRLAMKFAIGEFVVLAAITTTALLKTSWLWLVPFVIAVPLVGVEFWFDVRSRGRRLIPELCGSVGIASVAAVIVLAGDRGAWLAVGAWLILWARAVGSISFVRVQIARLHRRNAGTRSSDMAQVFAVMIGVVAVVTEHLMAAGLLGLSALVALQLLWVRREPITAKALGLRQMALGLGLVAVTAAGVLVL